jgi:transcriptional regulator with XRE-family HTH domain
MLAQLSPRQLRAARALLGWSRAELADRTDVSELTLHRIENDLNKPGQRTQDKIRTILHEHGIEFIDNEGVRLKPATVDILTGREGLRKFFDSVHEYASKHGGTIMMFGIDETTFIETITPEFSQNYLKRMTEVSRTRGDLEVLAIVCEGDTNFCASAYNEYRWISKDVFQAVPFYIYGETLAIMDFDTTPGPTIMLLKSCAVTNAYRKQFQAFWKMSKEPKVSKKPARAA